MTAIDAATPLEHLAFSIGAASRRVLDKLRDAVSTIDTHSKESGGRPLLRATIIREGKRRDAASTVYVSPTLIFGSMGND
jgi:hypothetical protein